MDPRGVRSVTQHHRRRPRSRSRSSSRPKKKTRKDPHQSPRESATESPPLAFATHIILQRLRPSTQKQYNTAFRHFGSFAARAQLPLPSNPEGLDALLVRFAEHVFTKDKGRGRQTAACARFACMWLNPKLKGKLPMSGAVLSPKAWNRAAGIVPQKHAPLTWPLACEISHRLSTKGERGAAVAVLVAFECCLRVSETANLRLSDVVDPNAEDPRLKPGFVLRIRNPKTGDLDQSVPALTPAVNALLKEWINVRVGRGAQRDGDGSLFGYNMQQLQELFRACACSLGGARFSWHSLRHGGSTVLFLMGWSTLDVMRHGRWRSAAGAWHYFQAGRATVSGHGVPARVVESGKRVAAALAAAFP